MPSNLAESEEQEDVPVATTIRAPTAGEQDVIERRANRRREGVSIIGQTWRGEGLGLSVIGAVATAASVILFFWRQKTVFIFAGAMGVMFTAIGLLGVRRARQATLDRLKAADREQAKQSGAVTEYRITADRIVTAAGDDGDIWWLFRVNPGAWLVFEQGQWDGLDGSTRQWCRDSRIGVDGHHAVVSIESTGEPLPVERRDLQPPNFRPTVETLFWTPPDDLGPLPAQITGDPTASRS